MMSEVVNRCGVTWVASAGNDGPALCTVGTPPAHPLEQSRSHLGKMTLKEETKTKNIIQ